MEIVSRARHFRYEHTYCFGFALDNSAFLEDGHDFVKPVDKNVEYDD